MNRRLSLLAMCFAAGAAMLVTARHPRAAALAQSTGAKPMSRRRQLHK